MATIVFTGGGTGGHVYPGLAVFDRLPAQARRRVVWVGSHRGVERRIVAQRGIPYRSVPTGKLRRYFDLENVLDAFRVIAGIAAAVRLLYRLRAKAVFSKGGFVAVPVVVAARLLRIPVLIHESDADPGLATRLTAPLATRVFAPYPETAALFARRLRSRVTVTGNPVRREFTSADPRTALATIGLPDDDTPVILVTGGSLGAQQINYLVRDSLDGLTAAARVVHQTGEHGRTLIPDLDSRAPAGWYHGRSAFGAEFPGLMRRADLVVARAGAGTIWEIATAGRPSILIPLSTGASRGDQVRNAARYAAAGACTVLDDPELSAERFLAEVLRLLSDEARRRRMAVAAAGWSGDDAAERIAAAVMTVATNGAGRRR